MKIKVNYDPQYAINSCDIDVDWLAIDIYDDGDIVFEIDDPHSSVILSTSQLSDLVDAAEKLKAARGKARVS